jgi:cytochrome c oxidase assembly factor CtaG
MNFGEFDRLFGLSGCFSGANVAGWTTDPSITVPLVLSLLIYAVGVTRLWRSAGLGHGARLGQVIAFGLGWLLLAMALVTPLHDLSRRLFAAHMVEHELVMTLAAPLLVHARPLGPFLWAFPRRSRKTIAEGTRIGAYLLGWDILTIPLVATAVHGAAIWIWHIPGLFELALRVEWIHWAQHLSFLISALFFWWTMLQGRARERGYGAAIFYLFFTAIHTSFLGILITLARVPVYPSQSQVAQSWGLTPLSDQQLAGLIMWVPAGMVYAIAALALAALWISRSSRQAGRPLAIGGTHGT